MKRLYVIVTTLLIGAAASTAQAKSMVRVKAIGASPRGQYVAFEEFGYQNGRKRPFSKIRIMNVWKNKYVAKPIHVIGRGNREELLDIRQKAKIRALKNLKRFNIAI